MLALIWIALAASGLITLALSYYGSTLITDIAFLAVPYTPRDYGWTFEPVSFQTEDGLRLTGWFVPASAPSAITLIILHGIGSNAGDMLPNTACLHSGPWNLLYVNFRGHADSEGKLTSLGPYEVRDLHGAMKFLKEQKPEATQQIGIYGHSLGAAVAIVGAARFPELLAVAAESPFRDVVETIDRFSTKIHGIPVFPFIPLALLITWARIGIWIGSFSPIREIARISPRPIFFIHGDRDRRIPTEDIEALYAAAGEPKELWIVPGADHGDPWMIAKQEYERRLVDFFRKALL